MITLNLSIFKPLKDILHWSEIGSSYKKRVLSILMTSLGKILQVKVGKSNVNPQASRYVNGARILFKPKRTNGEKVWVREKWVPFNSGTINQFYNLAPVDDEEY